MNAFVSVGKSLVCGKCTSLLYIKSQSFFGETLISSSLLTIENTITCYDGMIIDNVVGMYRPWQIYGVFSPTFFSLRCFFLSTSNQGAFSSTSSSASLGCIFHCIPCMHFLLYICLQYYQVPGHDLFSVLHILLLSIMHMPSFLFNFFLLYFWFQVCISSCSFVYINLLSCMVVQPSEFFASLFPNWYKCVQIFQI